MNHNKTKNPSRPGKLKTTLVAGVTAMALSGDAAPTADHDPHKAGGDGKQDVQIINPAKGSDNSGQDFQKGGPTKGGEWQPDPEREAKAAQAVAQGLTDSLKPSVEGMGGEGPSGLILMIGWIDAMNTESGKTIRVVDPIVASDERPADQLATGWVIVQDYDKEGNLFFRAINLADYDYVVTNPVNPEDPFVLTYGVPQPGKNGTQMLECDAHGNPLEDGAVPGQLMSTDPPAVQK